MGKKASETPELTAVFEKDTKRMRRYSIKENDEGVVGTLYVSKETKAPEEILITFE